MNGFSLWDRLSERDKKELQERLGVKQPETVVKVEVVTVQK